MGDATYTAGIIRSPKIRHRYGHVSIYSFLFVCVSDSEILVGIGAGVLHTSTLPPVGDGGRVWGIAAD